jgi:hypothetical protein
MNSAKLRRSRDVPEHHRSEIGKSFRFSSLALLYTAFLATFEQGESVGKALIFQRGRRFSFKRIKTLRLHI